MTKIGYLDIETTPAEVLSFSPYQFWNYKSFTPSKRFTSIICAVVTDIDTGEVHATSVHHDLKAFKANPYDDKVVLVELSKILSKFDVIVGHNSDQFDVKHINARLLFNGLKPIHQMLQIDTKKMAKYAFRFHFNKLDHIADFLGLGSKSKMEWQDWIDVTRGNVKKAEKMLRYCIQDTKLGIKVYKKLRPFCPSKFNYNAGSEGRPVCPACGKKDIVKNGFRMTVAGKFQKFVCVACGHWFKDTINLIQKVTLK